MSIMDGPASYRPLGGATGRGTGGGIGGIPDWPKGEEGIVLGGVDDDARLGVMGVACNASARASIALGVIDHGLVS